jgi:hypothetical protein
MKTQLTIGTTTNQGIYIGFEKSRYSARLVHKFKNSAAGVSEFSNLDLVEVITPEAAAAARAARVAAMTDHVAALPSCVMD